VISGALIAATCISRLGQRRPSAQAAEQAAILIAVERGNQIHLPLATSAATSYPQPHSSGLTLAPSQ